MAESKVEKSTSRYSGFTRFRKEWIEPVITAVVLVFIFKTFFFQNFKIPSGSMKDTLLIGDYLFASKFIYGTHIPFTDKVIWKFRRPQPDDIIIFRSVTEPDKDLIKRCVAGPGQTVEIRHKQLFVDGVAQPLPPHGKYIDPRVFPEEVTTRDNMPLVTVPAGHYFMMGDNRDDSNDSRFWGFLPEKNIKGKALFIYWSWDPTVPLHNVGGKIRWGRLFTWIR